MKRRKISLCDAKEELEARGIDLGEDFDALRMREVDEVLEVAKLAKYRKPKNAPRSKAAMFFAVVNRKRCGR